MLSNSGYQVYTVDLPNHGQSYHTDNFDYTSMVLDVHEFLGDQGIQQPVLIGHSMGGKVAMNLALSHPDALARLIVVDIAPRHYDLEHYTLIEGLNAIPLSSITSRNDADASLARYVPEADVRQFLLKNLQRKAEGGFSWKVNLPVITAKLKNVGEDLHAHMRFDKPTLFIRGRRSKYVLDADRARIEEFFPTATLVTMDTGHWVQAEKPQEFVEIVMNWIARV